MDICAVCSPCALGPTQERDPGLSSSIGWGQSSCPPRRPLWAVGGDGAGYTQLLHAALTAAVNQSPAMNTTSDDQDVCGAPKSCAPARRAREGSPFFPGRAGHSGEIAKQGPQATFCLMVVVVGDAGLRGVLRPTARARQQWPESPRWPVCHGPTLSEEEGPRGW